MACQLQTILSSNSTLKIITFKHGIIKLSDWRPLSTSMLPSLVIKRSFNQLNYLSFDVFRLDFRENSPLNVPEKQDGLSSFSFVSRWSSCRSFIRLITITTIMIKTTATNVVRYFCYFPVLSLFFQPAFKTLFNHERVFQLVEWFLFFVFQNVLSLSLLSIIADLKSTGTR